MFGICSACIGRTCGDPCDVNGKSPCGKSKYKHCINKYFNDKGHKNTLIIILTGAECRVENHKGIELLMILH